MIRNIKASDVNSIVEIYNYYIQHTVITFEEVLVTEEDMRQRIIEHPAHLPWIILERNDKVLGYAYASTWKSRCAYKHSVESTIYLRHDSTGKGYGTKLYSELVNRIRNQNFHAIIGGIALPNESSILLHENLGFEKVAHFKEVGYKFEKWIDVGYWELLIS